MGLLLATVAAIALGTPSGDGHISASKLTTVGERTTLAFTIATSAAEGSEVDIPLVLAPGARLVAMSTTHGTTKLVTSELAPDTARVRFEANADYRGLVLIEHVASSDSGNELRLRVAQVSRTQKARIVLSVVTKPVSSDWMTAEPTPRGYVAPTISLFAQPPISTAVPTVTIGAPVSACEGCDSIDSRAIRKYVRRQLPRLTACYERALRTNKKLEGTVALHFDIPPSGAVQGTTVDGSLPSTDVRSCIASDVAQWQFPAYPQAKYTVHVNYPLRFVTP